MARLLMIISSARSIDLASDKGHPTGYFADEVLKPYDKFVAAGVEVVAATPDGATPRPIPMDSSHGSTTLTKTKISCLGSCAVSQPI